MEEKVLSKEVAVRMLEEYAVELEMAELSKRTIKKYVADIMQWLNLSTEHIKKADVLSYKEKMCGIYKVSSTNSKIISINRYLKWLGYGELVVKTKRIQNNNSLENVITKEDYLKMLNYAKDNNKFKIYYIMKTIAQTGIRIGELKYVTVEAAKKGTVIVWNKGKYRTIYFTEELCKGLLHYCDKHKQKDGVIFCGREKGKAISPGAVWKSLKYIARQVEISEELVYPHSFRHLFAKQYMKLIGDISELADLLGHSRLETTWIYTKTSMYEKRKRLEILDL